MSKKLLSLLFIFWGLFASKHLYAEEPGVSYFNHIIIEHYNTGNYHVAKQGFQICINHFAGVIDIDNCKQYIRDCDNKIATADSINLKKLRETEERRKEIEERKLVYVSTDAMTLNSAYHEMGSAIKGYLSDCGFTFTDNPKFAYWSVYITAKAREYNYNAHEKIYYSVVNACIKTINNLTGETTYENEIAAKGGAISYAAAVPWAYQQLNVRLGKILADKLK